MDGDSPNLRSSAAFQSEGGIRAKLKFASLLHELARADGSQEVSSYFSPNALSLRTQHSLQLIHDTGRFNLEQVRDMKFSPKMIVADRVKRDLLDALDKSGP